MIRRGQKICPVRTRYIAAAVVFTLAVLQTQNYSAFDAGQSIAGYGSDGSWELEEEEINHTYEPAPFKIRLVFDDKIETLTEEDTAGWRSLREDGVYVWDEEAAFPYLESLGDKYDTEPGKVAFTTHDGISKIFDSEFCGWQMNENYTLQNIKQAVEDGETSVRPAWNSGLIYCSKNGVGLNYIEVDIAEQRVYLFENGEDVFEADCVTGTFKTTETQKGVYQVVNKSAPAILSDMDPSGKRYEQPVNYWVCFNQKRGQGLHDASWRGGFGGDIYKSWGSHGCVNLAEEDAKRIYEEAYVFMPVIVY